MAYQLQITTAQGTQVLPLNGIANSNIPAAPSASYTLIDEQGNPVTEDLSLTRRGDNLTLEVEGESVANIEEFYTVDGSQYVVDGTQSLIDGSAASAESMVISSSGLDASGNIIAQGAVWQAETSFLGLSTLQLVGAGLGSAAVVVGAAVSGSDSDSGSGSATDSTAPTNTFNSAAYDEASNTLTLTGTDMNTLLFGSEGSSSDIKDNFNWDNLQWDIGSDDTDNITFELADIDSVYVTDDNTLAITLTEVKANELENTSRFDDLTEDDSIEIATGFSGDTAGYASTTDAYVGEAAMDTSIVVFDLANGESSNHSDRTFDSDVSYTIYILVDSDSASVFSVDKWFESNNLGADDTVILVGNGSSILGSNGGFITNAQASSANQISWGMSTTTSLGALLGLSGSFARYFSNASGSAVLWEGGNWQNNPDSVGLLTTMPTGILTSQGLA